MSSCFNTKTELSTHRFLYQYIDVIFPGTFYYLKCTEIQIKYTWFYAVKMMDQLKVEFGVLFCAYGVWKKGRSEALNARALYLTP